MKTPIAAKKRKAVDDSMPELFIAILEFVQAIGRITVMDIVSLTNADRNTVKKHLECLVENNHLQQNGVGKGTWGGVKGWVLGMWLTGMGKWQYKGFGPRIGQNVDFFI